MALATTTDKADDRVVHDVSNKPRGKVETDLLEDVEAAKKMVVPLLLLAHMVPPLHLPPLPKFFPLQTMTMVPRLLH